MNLRGKSVLREIEQTSIHSNEMSEAFVKFRKRDHVRISIVPDAEAALRLINGWIEDYRNPCAFCAQYGFPSAVHQGQTNLADVSGETGALQDPCHVQLLRNAGRVALALR